MRLRWAVVWLVALSFVAVVGQIVIHRYARLHAKSYQDRIGKIISCPSCLLFSDIQAEVLLDGLEDVKGVAVVGDQVYLVQDHGPLVVFSPGMFKTYPVRAICPEVNCDASNPGGIVSWNGNMLIAEKRQITEMGQSAGKQEHVQLALFEQPHPSQAAPVGLAVVDNTLFFTADPAHCLGLKDVHRGCGSLVTLTLSSQARKEPLKISSNLTHPSGIAVAGEFGPIYLTEEYPERVVWSVYKYDQCTKAWRRFGELAAVPRNKQTIANFRGLALWRDVILAAGPAGLYAFSTNGTSLGGMEFDEPVTGIAVAAEMRRTQRQNFVYFAVGHKLCRIGLREPPPTEAAAAQNEESMRKPCPNAAPQVVFHPKAVQPAHSSRKNAACPCS